MELDRIHTDYSPADLSMKGLVVERFVHLRPHMELNNNL